MALGQTLTGRQPPGRAAGCTDLHLHMGFHPGKGELCEGKRRWRGQTGTQNPKSKGQTLLSCLPGNSCTGWKGVSMGTERPPIYSSHGPPPQPQLLGPQLSLPTQALGTTRQGWEGGVDLCQMWGLRKLPKLRCA